MKLGKILISLFFLMSSVCKAEDFHIIDLEELFVDYKNYGVINEKQRHLLIYPESPKEGLNLNVNTSLVTYGYFNSVIESLTTSGQYRGIGLQISLGIRIFKFLDVGFYHHSQHVLDREITTLPKFPTEDALQIKLYLYRKNSSDSIL
jgi:hypothetical protein